MNPDFQETERRVQAIAEQLPSAADDAAVARYRYVLHAIRQLQMPLPPDNFAQQMEAQLQDYPEESFTERCLLSIVTVALVFLALAMLGPWLTHASNVMASASVDVPWPFVTALASGLVGFAAFDGLREHQRSRF